MRVGELVDDAPREIERPFGAPLRIMEGPTEYVYQFDPCGCRFVPGRQVKITLHVDRNPHDIPEEMRDYWSRTSLAVVTMLECAIEGADPPAVEDDGPPAVGSAPPESCCAPERNRR